MNTSTVLVIDDSDVDRELIKRALKDHEEFHLHMVGTGEDGRAAVDAVNPDIVLLDYNLPDMDGLNLLLEICTDKGSEQPVFIMMTGEGNEILAVNALKAGAKDYLVKSTDGRYLLRLPHVIKAAIHSKALDNARESLEIQKNLALTVLNSINESVAVFDTAGRILSVNRAFTETSGYGEKELIGSAIYTLFDWNRHASDYRQTLLDALQASGGWEGEMWQRRKSHGLYLSSLNITGLRDSSGVIKEFVCVGKDITAAKQREDKIRYQAFHDGLTGLPNRELLRDRFAFYRAHADRNNTQIAVLFVDLDGFKAVNDCCGHESGDYVLKQVARRLKACVRESDTVARYGGDEFVVIANDLVDVQQASVVADEILSRLKEPCNFNCDHRVDLSASIGIATYPAINRDLEWLLEAADEAMYEVKNTGKSGYRFAGVNQ